MIRQGGVGVNFVGFRFRLRKPKPASWVFVRLVQADFPIHLDITIQTRQIQINSHQIFTAGWSGAPQMDLIQSGLEHSNY